jgi:hypothetical protein
MPRDAQRPRRPGSTGTNSRQFSDALPPQGRLGRQLPVTLLELPGRPLDITGLVVAVVVLAVKGMALRPVAKKLLDVLNE